MATFSKLLLSGSTDGLGIKITTTTTAGNLIHTADALNKDEIWLYAVNSQAAAVKLTLEWGGVSVPDNSIEISIPGESGLYAIVPGFILTNSKVVRAFAGTANVLIVYGWVNRIS